MSVAAGVPRRRALLAAALLSGAASLLGGCARSTPESELRATVERMAQAIEAQQPADFLDALADDFIRDSGAFGKQDVRRLLTGALLRNERIALAWAITGVEVQGERARVRLRVVATGSAGGLLPERGQIWDFDSHWRRTAGRWQVFNAEWHEGL